MKATTEAAGSAIDKASQEAIATDVSTLAIDFIRGSKGDNYRLVGDLRALPLDDDAFLTMFAKLGFTSLVHRTKEGKAEWPANGGNITMAMFETAIRSVVFRGDEKPNSDDEKVAQAILNSIEAKTYTAEQAVARIKKAYGWEVSPDKAGFALHAMNKRLKEAEAKAKEAGNLETI
jgi:hypothetical protein